MPSSSATSSNFRTILRITSGNFLEMFDFFLFGFYASAIAQTFFPTHNAVAALLLTFGTFGAGFLMRPLGALILGAVIDRIGRRRGLILTLSIMACGTFLIAATPGYATIGLLAPLVVLLGRLLQGFSAGVELGGVSVYLAETAPPRRKGWMVSWQSASQQVAVIVASAIGFALNLLLSPSDLLVWGWRLPFALGCAIVPVIYILRRHLQETPEFLNRTYTSSIVELRRTLIQHWRLILQGLLLVAMTTVSFYLITVYTPTFGQNTLHLSANQSLGVTCAIGLSNFIWLPIMGEMSDRRGRRPLLLIASGLMLLTAYPLLSWLVIAPTPWRLLSVELWFSFLYASYNGAMVVALTELVPATVRTTGFSLAYSLATAIFGGFTPVICTTLIAWSHDRASPGWWLSISALLSLFAALYLPRGISEHQPPPAWGGMERR